MTHPIPASGQAELSFDAKPVHPTAVASIEEVQKVVTILGQFGMLTSGEICVKLGLLVNDNNKRKVRAIARASYPGILSFVGSDGYKLAKDCTLEEIWAARNALARGKRDLICKELLLDQLIFSRGGGKL